MVPLGILPAARGRARAFRLDRIDAWRLLDETFVPRTGATPLSETIVARVRVAPYAVRWVRERQHYGFQQEETVPNDSGVIMTYRVDALQELMPWLLSWGAAVEALEPPSLRAAQRDEVARLLEILT